MNYDSKILPLVSVIIPCRNEVLNIAACLISILTQDEPEGKFEIIVADGMSDDGTREILNDVADMHNYLTVIDNPGQIVSTGLNLGIKTARGEIIIRMDVRAEYAKRLHSTMGWYSKR